jgi:ubiquinone/menaquinone biosynthesis C-methylase UbiE
MSIMEQLGLEERAHQLRNPTGATGLAVADMLNELNREGNLRAVKELQVTWGAQVLEVGCGTGSMARAVIDQAEGVSYAGIDSSPTMIDAARDRNSDLIGRGLASFHEAYSEQMPFDGARFTKVFSIGVIHFWPDPLKALTEILRVMRPGGLMLMGCLGPERAPPFARAEYGFHLHDPQKWRSFCLAAGFSTVEVHTRSLGSDGGPQLIHLAAQT